MNPAIDGRAMPVQLQHDSFLHQGSYALMNAWGGTVLDFWPTRANVVAWRLHARDNQQWTFVNTGMGWAIQSCYKSQDGQLVYVSIEGLAREGAAIVFSTIPVSWYVWWVDGALRVTWPNTDYVIALSNGGSSEGGTPAQLERLKRGHLHQLWHYSRCDPLPTLEPATIHANLGQLDAANSPTPAIYVLTNMQDEIALELESIHRTSVRHGPVHREPSQQWKFIAIGNEAAIQACRMSLDDRPLYLTVQGRAEQGARVVASPYPVPWCVERSQYEEGKQTMRIFWPKTNLVMYAQKSADHDNVLLAQCDDTLSSKWIASTVAV